MCICFGAVTVLKVYGQILCQQLQMVKEMLQEFQFSV